MTNLNWNKVDLLHVNKNSFEKSVLGDMFRFWERIHLFELSFVTLTFFKSWRKIWTNWNFSKLSGISREFLLTEILENESLILRNSTDSNLERNLWSLKLITLTYLKLYRIWEILILKAFKFSLLSNFSFKINWFYFRNFFYLFSSKFCTCCKC